MVKKYIQKIFEEENPESLVNGIEPLVNGIEPLVNDFQHPKAIDDWSIGELISTENKLQEVMKFFMERYRGRFSVRNIVKLIYSDKAFGISSITKPSYERILFMENWVNSYLKRKWEEGLIFKVKTLRFKKSIDGGKPIKNYPIYRLG